MKDLTKFSVSDANLFKLCPRRMYFEKVEGWSTAETPKALELGIAYDKLLENYDIKGYEAAAFEIPYLFKDDHEAADAEVLLYHYHQGVKAQPLPPVADRGNQHGFGIETELCKITGYLDKLSFTEVSGIEQHVVVERKTTSEPIEENSAYWKKLDLDPQIRSYAWYLRKKGLKAGWVCYEVLRKLSSAYDRKLTKKSEIPIDEYRSLLASLNYNKTLFARKWFYVSEEMTQEFESEHLTVFSQFSNLIEYTREARKAGYNSVDTQTCWPKHEQSCDAWGGCPFAPVCKKQIELDSHFIKKEGRFTC